MVKRVCKAFTIAFCMLLLIVDTKTAIHGASEGVDLCIRVLIPSLFPFFIISVLLTDSLAGATHKFMQPITKLLNIPRGSESLFLIGMLGGYPVGAQAVAQTYKRGFLDKDDAERMLSFCNNAGPSFLFGVVSTQFSTPAYTWLIWAVLLLSSIITGILMPSQRNSAVCSCDAKGLTLTQAMKKSIEALSCVCGWIVTFKVIIAFSDRWFLWLFPKPINITIQMLLELANGCVSLNMIENVALRFIICTTGLSLGGICVFFQTVSVTGPLKVSKYISGKFLQAGISLLLSIPIAYIINRNFSYIYVVVILLSVTITAILLSLYKKKQQIKYGILLSGGV